MKRILKISASLLSIFALMLNVACGGANSKPDEDNVFRVGMECGYAPYNWSQSDDSNGAVPIDSSKDFANGYDVMIAKKIADSMGKELKIYKIDWDGLPLALQAGTVDAVIAGQSITAKREETVDFSSPYYYASIVALTKADSKYANAAGVADLEGATVTSQINTVWYDECLTQIPNANILPPQETAPAMLVALDAGKADVIVCDMPAALAAAQVYKDFKLLDFSGSENDFKVSDEEINIGVSVKKGNTKLATEINKVLDTMTAEDFKTIMEEAISIQPLNM